MKIACKTRQVVRGTTPKSNRARPKLKEESQPLCPFR
jgi:hypothetical protein